MDMDHEPDLTVANHLGQALENADYEIRLDEHAKELLADKYILAEIVKRLIPDFRDMPRDEIRNYIQADPYISRVRVHPGETNPSLEKADAIRSEGQESRTPNEGLASFDVLFSLTLPDSGKASVEVYIDIEAQGTENLRYYLETRAVYYLARLLSSQYQRDFKHAEYEKLRKAYSIWIVMDPSSRNADTISSIAFRQDAVYGNPEDNKGYDRAQAFIVRLQPGADRSEDRLVSLLSMLFSAEISPIEKEDVLTREYSIPVTEQLERKVYNMCNYSTYVRNKSMQQGIQQGMQQGMQQGREQTEAEVFERLRAMNIPEDQARYAAYGTPLPRSN